MRCDARAGSAPFAPASAWAAGWARCGAPTPGAGVDRRTEDLFGVTLVRVPGGAGGRLDFAVDVRSRRVTHIGVPAVAFCE